MNLSLKLGSIFLAGAQALSVYGQTHQGASANNRTEAQEIGRYIVSCTGQLADVQSEVFANFSPKYKSAEANAAYEYFFALGQKQFGSGLFNKMVADHETPMFGDFIKAQVYRKDYPKYEAQYLLLGSKITQAADGCIESYRIAQARRPS